MIMINKKNDADNNRPSNDSDSSRIDTGAYIPKFQITTRMTSVNCYRSYFYEVPWW